MKFSKQFEYLHQLASERTGLNDFGPADYEDAMRLVLSDIDKYATYNEAGVQTIFAQIVNNLAGRLVAQKSFTDHPELLDTPIEKPVFIIGTPRSGTTVLHRLITSESSIQTLPYWLGNLPVPRPPRDQWEDNPWYQMVDQEYVQKFYKARPEAATLHPIKADKADECRWVVDQSFWNTYFLSAVTAPNYTKWGMETDKLPVYEYYRKVLAIVSNGDTRPWMLKDPAHMFCIDAIMSVFPDARILQTHREPVTGIASTSNLVWAMRRDLEPELTAPDVGELILKTWGVGLKMMEESRRKYDKKQFFDVHMLETRHHPLETMQRIYEHFEMPVSEETLTAWSDELERDPNQEHSIGKYEAGDFGINETNVAEHVGVYAERYKKVCEAKGL